MKKPKHRKTCSFLPVLRVTLLGYDMLNENGGWIPVRRDEFDGGYDWEFRHTDTVVLDNGDVVYNGDFSISCHTSPDKTGEFVYIPSKGLLYITVGDTPPDAVSGGVDIYVVERVNRNGFLLYPIETAVRILVSNVSLR